MANNESVLIDARGVKIGGKYTELLCASLFYFRIPRAHWAERIEKLKRSGYNCVDVYLPWNYHEREDGSFDFTEERDLKEFLSLLAESGIYVIVRPGPYICSEWTGGAIPARILESGMPVRCDNKAFLGEVERWYFAALKEVAPFEYGKGGTVILLQLDNELDFYVCPDPNAYIGKLRDMAKKAGITVPYFCCAGQYGIEKSGGMTEGVNKTLNCYPDSLDTSFDRELRGYGLLFREKGEALMVSETNRDHFLLRRELSCGSKLLGAYNQVGGNNFDFNESVNNWGDPVAFLAAEYDFSSMIDTAGNYTGEVRQAFLFSLVLNALGEKIAGALPAKETVVPTACNFPYAEGGMSVLELLGGGKAVCAANFGEEEGLVSFSLDGKKITASVPARTAPFLLFNVDLRESGVNAVLACSNCELIGIGKNQLTFLASNTPFVWLDFGDGKEVTVGKSGIVNGVSINFATLDEIMPADLKGHLYKNGGKVKPYLSDAVPAFRKYPAKERVNFGELGVSGGIAKYTVQIPKGKKLFVEAPADMLSYETDGKCYPTLLADGKNMYLPASESGKYIVTAHKWGHCNFDDPQAPSLRLSCKKGVTSFGYVEREEKLGRANFKLLSSFGDREIDLSEPYPIRIDISKWNTTIKPCICAYTFPVKRTAERLILTTSEAAEVAVYLDGKLLGLCDFGSFELTSFCERDREYRMTLVYRKRVWTQDVGEARLYSVNAVKAESEVLSKREFSRFKAEKNKEISLPLQLTPGKPFAFAVDVSDVQKEGFLVFEGKNVLLTCVLGGRVVSRNLIGWENAPRISGGDPKKVYLSPAWCKRDKILSVYAEPLGEGAVITNAAYLL